jgi:phenylacetate-CoA ligase
VSPYTALCAHFLFPLHERLKGHTSVAMHRELEKSQWWPPQRLDSHRVERLRDFLLRIAAEVPYYRELFRRSGFDPRSVDRLEALRALPLLDKATIRAHFEQLKAERHGRVTRYNTGGSSGEPLIFHIGAQRKSHDVAAKWRATRWWNVDIGDPEVVVWGSPIELGAQDRLRRWRDGVFRSRLVPAFDMSPENVDRFIAQIRHVRPAMLFGYPSSLALIAARGRRQGVALDGLGIRVVFVTAEKLYDDQRRTIASAFGCPVANGYGARDAGFIAHECPAGSLHVSAEHIVVETLRPDGSAAGDGEAGEIVVTHMATPEFPFVRYRTGDIGVLTTQPCTCGRGLPVLADVQGRTTDFVVARDGTVMHGLALIYTLRDLTGVESFRIIQHSLDRTEVQLVCGSAFRPDDERRIVRDFKARLGHDVTIDVRHVPCIANETSGKFRYVTSRVAPDLSKEPALHA